MCENFFNHFGFLLFNLGLNACSITGHFNFISLVLQKVAAGVTNKVATLTKIKSMRYYGK